MPRTAHILDRALLKLETALALLGGVVIFALVLLTTLNIIGRWAFNIPVDGYIDWVEQSMAFMAFLGLAYTQRLGAHIRMDLCIARLSGRGLWVAEWASSLLMWGITALLLYGSWLHFLRAYQIGDSSFDIGLPTWPAKIVVPISLAVLLLRLSVQLVAYALAIFRNRAPVGVPDTVDVVQQSIAHSRQTADSATAGETNP